MMRRSRRNIKMCLWVSRSGIASILLFFKACEERAGVTVNATVFSNEGRSLELGLPPEASLS